MTLNPKRGYSIPSKEVPSGILLTNIGKLGEQIELKLKLKIYPFSKDPTYKNLWLYMEEMNMTE